ncbi:MAG: carbamoyltransferase HypF [Salinivirgaceae bacterium]
MQIENQTTLSCYVLHIKGLVQGVGFRPYIYRIARKMKLKGWVENRNNGVFVKVSASANEVKFFEETILSQSPLAAQIQSIFIEESVYELFNDFQIIKSKSTSDEITQVSPDIAVCHDCLLDMKQQFNRKGFPFINCTNCGPRFSIIQKLPYDRPFTTMNSFSMCETCKKEYSNVDDRRFHAQPIACNECGPAYRMKVGENVFTQMDEILNELAKGIALGKVYAVKGLGGFHLMCDAQNESAVARIREIKNRDGKPFAIMVPTISEIEKIAEINSEELKLLESWQRPIVLLNYKIGLAPEVTNGLNRVGVMLPYMPFQHLIFQKLQTKFIVLTSGNVADEPITIDNEKATLHFRNKVDGIIDYNRDIYNRVDDSVCAVINNEVRIIRRSRGFTPQPIHTNSPTEGIFAAGAELVNSFCMGKGYQALLSQYLGDLKNMETFQFYEETYQRFEKLFRFKPELIATDLHPNYLSSQFGRELSDRHRIPLVKIQHHHAHVASVMAVNQLDTDVIGVSFDGTGLGIDGKTWGAEFMLANLTDFDRLFHFEEMPLPGGDKTSKEPWRMALSYLYSVFGDNIREMDLPVINTIERSKIDGVIQMLEKRVNTPMASSAGRLFDAVASIIGLAHFNTFQAEAPMRLEAVINKEEKGKYDYTIIDKSISFIPMIKQIVTDYHQGKEPASISAKFHNMLIDMIVQLCLNLSKERNIKNIVLSGGTFQNNYLTGNIENLLKRNGLSVYLPKSVPINDQGIALGQLAIAAKRRSLGLL